MSRGCVIGVLTGSSSPFAQLETVDVLKRERISVFALKDKQISWAREEVEITDEARSIKLPNLCELLHCVVHLLRDFGAKINVRTLHDLTEWLTQPDPLHCHVEVHVQTVLVPHSRIV